MNYKIIGAMLIILTCGGFGLHLAGAHRRETAALHQLKAALEYMRCQLQFRLAPLPELCRGSAAQTEGCIREFFQALAEELDSQISPDVRCCVAAAMGHVQGLPERTGQMLALLGQSLGQFDLQGQLQSLDNVRLECMRLLETLETDQTQRLRSYRTLGFCAGAALAILFL